MKSNIPEDEDVILNLTGVVRGLLVLSDTRWQRFGQTPCNDPVGRRANRTFTQYSSIPASVRWLVLGGSVAVCLERSAC